MVKQTLLAIVAVGVLIGGLVVWFGASDLVRAQQPPPTPKGQLGGAPRLTPLIGGETTVTPAPSVGTPTAVATSAGAARCTIAPRQLQDVTALIATPASATAVVTQGNPADSATVDAVTRVLNAFVACLNDGDQLRALAYMTDDAVHQSLSETGWDAAAASARLAPLQPRPAPDRITIRAISDVMEAPGGQLVATVVLADPTRFPLGVVTTWQVRFALLDGNWRIDAVTMPAQ